MNDDLAREWIEKADHDYQTALIVFRTKKKPLYDMVCFHCQQCIEKIFKGYLIHKGGTFSKTHDLDDLRKRAVVFDGGFSLLEDLADRLNVYAVDIRYPGDEPDRKEAGRAIKAMKEIRAFVREKLKGRI